MKQRRFNAGLRTMVGTEVQPALGTTREVSRAKVHLTKIRRQPTTSISVALQLVGFP